jgi:uncharacterized protein YutE (UPF0331/DUF86 family)
MADDVLLNKSEIIENCLRRIHEEYAGNPDHLRKNQTKQDSILLNLERACQATIDMSMRVTKLRKLGLPKESREAFILMMQNGLLSSELNAKMQALVGFRNTAVHNYRKLDLDIFEAVIKNHLEDFTKFVAVCLKLD